MSKTTCGMIKDLLPLYAENLCSPESREAVVGHLAGCSACKAMLAKMNTPLAVTPDTDISMMQRVRKRILIEKIVIAAVSLLVAFLVLWFVYFKLVNTDCSMDYAACNLATDVWVEEDTEGMLWLVKRNEASTACYVYPTVSDTSGRHMGYDDDFDTEHKVGFGVTLKQRCVDSFAMLKMNTGNEERTQLFNKADKPHISQVFYYDDKNDAEYVLWERN